MDTSIEKNIFDSNVPTPTVDDVLDPDDGEPHVQPLTPSQLHRKLGEALKSERLQREGRISWLARKILQTGKWIEREVDERRQTIGGIDNLWLLLADATNSDFNPVCACTFTLRGKLTVDKLIGATERLMKKFPKYGQRLTSVGRKWHGARFEDDPHFDYKNHVHVTQLPEPGGKHQLETLMGEFIAQDWDLSKPLWEMLIVENYEDEDGAECALIVRGHHTLADGQGFVISQLYMTSYHDELVNMMSSSAEAVSAAETGTVTPSSVHPLLKPLDRLSEPSNVLIAPLVQLFLASVFWISYALTLAVSFGYSTYHLVLDVFLCACTAWRVEMLTAPQPHGAARTKLKEFASSASMSMQDVRTCQKAFSGRRMGAEKDGKHRRGHVTVNDVMCAVMADVLGDEIRSKPVDFTLWGRVKRALAKVLPSPIGFFIPISIRSPGDWSMRNLSTGWLVYLYPSPPSNLPAPSVPTLHQHIHTCRTALTSLKHSLWPRIFFYIIQATGQVPVLYFGLTSVNALKKRVIGPIVDASLRSFPVILTNVPGPAKKPVTLEGMQVVRWTALPPQGGKGTVGMGLISYAGSMCISVAADRVPASAGVARRLCERFEERFREYVRAAEQVLDEVKGE